MAYSFIASTTQKTEWQKLHKEVFKSTNGIEMFPIASSVPNVFYLGICIPFSRLETYPDTWNVLVKIISELKTTYSFEIFDLYNGFFVDDQNIEQVKKSLTS